MKRDLSPTVLFIAAAATTGVLPACSNDQSANPPRACDAEPELLTTPDGVEFVRTPDACFADLPDWPYEPHYVELDGLQQAYVDEGPADGPVVLLLHGQPSWSYLYRTMIPVLADAGFRVIAMDHLGMGRSDKPVDISSYSYVGHADRLTRFIEALDLRDINLFVQDWGSLIGLRVAGLNPDRFARIAVGNGTLPNVPAGFTPFPPVEEPDVMEDVPSPFAGMPDQQLPFYEDCEPLQGGEVDFGGWMTYAMKASSFRPSEVLEALTWFPLSPEEEDAYDAPFPSRLYMAGPRTFPSLVNELPGANAEAWAGLTSFERPFLTIWADNDAGTLGRCETQEQLVTSIPGATGLPHARISEASHFLQDDQGVQIAERLVPFFRDEITPILPFEPGDRYCEILLLGPASDGGIEAEVWGTQNLNTCPAESWEALDPAVIQAETGALSVSMNGPRVWLAPVSEASEMDLSDRQSFGDLEMRRLATVVLDPSDLEMERGPYIETTVVRTTTYLYEAGTEIYELTSPEGGVYVMQSMSQIVDADLTLDQLPGLGAALMLPDGWSYGVRVLDADLEMASEGAAVVLTDELQNAYQRR